jgi:GMP synthase-like glutamine amidotransferase
VKTLLVVQHTSAEYLGLMEDHFEGRHIRFRYHRPFTAGGKLPAADALADGLVLLGGGPWGSAGERDLPTLQQEVALARAALAAGLPLIAIGLGAQVLSIAAGGASRPAPLEFSVGTARRVRPEALGGYLPERYPLVRYGRDRAVPPGTAEVLAVDDEGGPALFRCAERAFGFAGHPGIKAAIVEDLIMEFAEGPAEPADALAQLRRVTTAIEDALVPIMTGLVQATGLMAP